MIERYRWLTRRNGVPEAFVEQLDVPPRIPRDLLSCAVFIYESDSDARSWRVTGGTGVLVAVPHDGFPDGKAHYVVTNSHVIPRGGSIVLRLSRAFPAIGYDTVNVPVNEWVRHPDGDDVAAHLFTATRHLYDHEPVPLSWLMTRSDVEGRSFVEGDECLFIGRQFKLDGKERNTPCARFGTVAMMNPEPIVQARRDNFAQESIVIEARSLNGFSGSPVFVYRAATMMDNKDAHEITKNSSFAIHDLGERPMVGSVLGSPLAMLGIDWGHFNARNVIVSPDLHLTAAQEHDLFNAGMMMAVPAWKIESLLMSEGMRQMRDEKAEEAQRAYEEAGEPVMDSLGSSGRDEDRVSLDGVSPAEALRALLNTPPHGQASEGD